MGTNNNKMNTRGSKPNSKAKTKGTVSKVASKSITPSAIKLRASRLIETCEKALFKDTLGLLTIRGVENLSRNDVEAIMLYCKSFMEYGSINGLMIPNGLVAQVLQNADLIACSTY